jgi:hypothetical protein
MTQEKHSAESRIDDGGAAFPVRMGYYSQGMSLRDWFAGMALQGILANPATILSDIFKDGEGWHCPETIADCAIESADALLAAVKPAARKPAEQRCEYCGGCGMIAGKEPDDDVMNTPCPRCNPHAEPEWIEWNGSPCCPVADGVIGDFKFRDGGIVEETNLFDWHWEHDTLNPRDEEIIAYRIGGKP